MNNIQELRDLNQKLKQLRDLPEMEKKISQEVKAKNDKHLLKRYENNLEQINGEFYNLKRQIEDDKEDVKNSLKNLLENIKKITQTHNNAKNVAGNIAKLKYDLGLGFWSKSNSTILNSDILHEVDIIFQHYGIDENLIELQKLTKFTLQLSNFLSPKSKPPPMYNIVDHDPQNSYWEK